MSNLALTMRPEKLADVLGNESTKRAIESFIKKGDFPNVFLFSGPPGTGKTTLAEIVVREAGCDPSAIHQINGSDKNGVDDARELAEMASSRPLTGLRRAFIINEFHQMTINAQDVLKDPMEKSDALWIITTDRPDKVSPAIKSRAAAATFDLRPLDKGQLSRLVAKAVAGNVSVTNGQELVEFLWKNGITSPREILGVLDQYLAGVPLEEAIHGSEHEPLYKEVAGAVLRGHWDGARAALSQIKTADSRGLIAITSAFFRSELLKTPAGPRADGLASCLVGLDSIGYADGTAYGAATALLYKACRVLSK